MLSIVITTLSYMGMAVIAGCIVLRDASGSVDEFNKGTYTDCTGRKCNYGLHNGFSVSPALKHQFNINTFGCWNWRFGRKISCYYVWVNLDGVGTNNLVWTLLYQAKEFTCLQDSCHDSFLIDKYRAHGVFMTTQLS